MLCPKSVCGASKSPNPSVRPQNQKRWFGSVAEVFLCRAIRLFVTRRRSLLNCALRAGSVRIARFGSSTAVPGTSRFVMSPPSSLVSTSVAKS
jgi:hypothetical protein